MRRHPFTCWSLLALFLSGFVTSPASAANQCTAGNPNPNSIEATPSSDFLSIGSEIVIHGKTGLWWKACSEGLSWQSNGTCAGTASSLSWQAALIASKTANTNHFGGFTDWRLPNKKELESIVETCGYLPAIDVTAFPDGPSRNFWSSTTYISSTTQAWGVGFGDGGTFAGPKTDANLVRLVRGPGSGVGIGDGVGSFDLVNPTVSVIYQGNGNNGGAVPVDNHNYASGAAATIVGNTGGLYRSNFNFSGWNTLANGLGDNYVAGNTVTIGSLNSSLFANWTSFDSMLIALSVSAGTLVPTLSPVFSSATLAYTASIPNANSYVIVTPTSDLANATIRIKGGEVPSKADSPKFNMTVGSNVIPIVVTSPDGKAVTNYKITVTRANALPNAPTISSAVASTGSATVSFSTTIVGGLATSFTASCTAAGHTTRSGTGTASPVIVHSLAGGVAYACSVVASNSLGDSAASVTRSVTPRPDLTPILMLLLD